MDNRSLSELIGLIYDVAYDVDLWPRLLEALADRLEPILAEGTTEGTARAVSACTELIDESRALMSHSHGTETGRSPENRLEGVPIPELALADLLRSHFSRALRLTRRFSEVREERDAMEELLERLPLGMMIVDSESHVLAYNRWLQQIISESKGVSVTNGVVSAMSSTDTVGLRKLIRAAAEGNEREAKAIRLRRSDIATPLSAFVFPFRANTCLNGMTRNHVVVLFAAPEMHLEIPSETLMSLYQLTAAEARLVSSLVKDHSLNSIAEDFGISKHTIRTQLKSIYEKTGTHRQAELVRRVVTGPAMLAAVSGKEENAVRSGPGGQDLRGTRKPGSRRHQVVRLPDNRLLGYAEYGVADGFPVMFMHGIIGSRLQRHPDETIVERCGVRLIIPDRPGVGLSDKRENMTLLGWADDVKYLADYLGIKHFNMIGYSVGGAFGLACAFRLRERIRRLILASGIAPFTSIWDLDGMSAPFRLILCLGKYTPSLLGPLVRLMGLQRKPEVFHQELCRQMPPADRSLLSQAAIGEQFAEDMRECLRQGDHHILLEVLMISRHWGFELGDVQVRVELWHGELDRMVPLRVANRLAETLPSCEANIVAGAGHYLLYGCWEEILRAANGP